MRRKRASDFPQELLDLFDGYVHGGISRRQFLPPRSYGNGGAVWHRRRHAKMMKVSHGPGE
jgi:hypothetical protein